MGPDESDILIPKPHPGSDNGVLRSRQAQAENRGGWSLEGMRRRVKGRLAATLLIYNSFFLWAPISL